MTEPLFVQDIEGARYIGLAERLAYLTHEERLPICETNKRTNRRKTEGAREPEGRIFSIIDRR